MPVPWVRVTDPAGNPLGGAIITIAGRGKDFLCAPGDAGIGDYDCGGPRLGGDYAVRVYKTGFENALEIVKFDDACSYDQFHLSIKLEPKEEPTNDAGSDAEMDVGNGKASDSGSNDLGDTGSDGASDPGAG